MKRLLFIVMALGLLLSLGCDDSDDSSEGANSGVNDATDTNDATDDNDATGLPACPSEISIDAAGISQESSASDVTEISLENAADSTSLLVWSVPLLDGSEVYASCGLDGTALTCMVPCCDEVEPVDGTLIPSVARGFCLESCPEEPGPLHEYTFEGRIDKALFRLQVGEFSEEGMSGGCKDSQEEGPAFTSAAILALQDGKILRYSYAITLVPVKSAISITGYEHGYTPIEAVEEEGTLLEEGVADVSLMPWYLDGPFGVVGAWGSEPYGPSPRVARTIGSEIYQYYLMESYNFIPLLKVSSGGASEICGIPVPMSTVDCREIEGLGWDRLETSFGITVDGSGLVWFMKGYHPTEIGDSDRPYFLGALRTSVQDQEVKKVFLFGYIDTSGRAWSTWSNEFFEGTWECEPGDATVLEFVEDAPVSLGSGYVDAAVMNVMPFELDEENMPENTLYTCLLKEGGAIERIYMKDGTIVREVLGTFSDAAGLVEGTVIDSPDKPVRCIYRDGSGQTHVIRASM